MAKSSEVYNSISSSFNHQLQERLLITSHFYIQCEVKKNIILHEFHENKLELMKNIFVKVLFFR